MVYSSFLSFLLGNSMLFLLVRPAYQFFPATGSAKSREKRGASFSHPYNKINNNNKRIDDDISAIF